MLMLNAQMHNKKAVAALLLLVLLLFQTILASAEFGSPHRLSSEKIDAHCTHDCFERAPENIDEKNSDYHEGDTREESTHCDDCDHCLGCHLSVIAHHFATHPILGPRFSFTYLARLTRMCPTNINRPPIA